MPLHVRTHEEHPDPGLRTRFFHADPHDVFHELAGALEEHHRWELEDRDAERGTVVTRTRRWLPPVRDRVEVTVTGHGDHATQVTAALERSGLGKLRFLARDALKEVLREVDMRFQQAKDSPLRTLGYGEEMGERPGRP